MASSTILTMSITFPCTPGSIAAASTALPKADPAAPHERVEASIGSEGAWQARMKSSQLPWSSFATLGSVAP